MKSILHVVNVPFVIPYYFGDQLTFFKNQNYKIFIASHDSERLEFYEAKWNFRAYRVDIKRTISPLHDIISILKLVKIINNNKIEIVVGHTPKGALLSMISSFIAKVPKRIYFRHGLMYETSFGLKRLILMSIEKLTSILATEVVCVSNSVLQISRDYKLSNPNKLRILNRGTCNGIDTELKFNKQIIDSQKIKILRSQLKIENDDFIVGFVGRIAKDKGLEELVDAWLKLLKANNQKKTKLIICGPVDSRDPVNRSTLNVIQNDSTIIHIGEIDNTEEYYSLFDVFILPSYREGFPTVVLEASSMELPIITSRSTGCIDSIVENKTGVFTEITAIDIYSKIQFYINNPTIAKLHGINGREFVKENFSQKIIWNDLLKNVYN